MNLLNNDIQVNSPEAIKAELITAIAMIGEVHFEIESLFEAVMENFTKLTNYQKSQAIKNGYLGKYGHVNKLTGHVVLRWISIYAEDNKPNTISN